MGKKHRNTSTTTVPAPTSVIWWVYSQPLTIILLFMVFATIICLVGTWLTSPVVAGALFASALHSVRSAIKIVYGQ